MGDTPIVFLDRDGTLNVDHGYVCRAEDIQLIAGAAAFVASLHQSGARVVVISNQSAVGRGFCSLKDVEATNRRLEELLLKENPAAILSGVFFCPHRPEEDCLCRKPKTGLLEQVRARWSFDPTSCWMVGDKESDVEFGLAAGIPSNQCLRIASTELDKPSSGYLVGTLLEAEEIIERGLMSKTD